MQDMALQFQSNICFLQIYPESLHHDYKNVKLSLSTPWKHTVRADVQSHSFLHFALHKDE